MNNTEWQRIKAVIEDLGERRRTFSGRTLRTEAMVYIDGHVTARLPNGRWASTHARRGGVSITTVMGFAHANEIQLIGALSRLGLLAQCDADAYCARLKDRKAAWDRDNWISWARAHARTLGYRLVKAKKRTAKK